MLAAPIIDLPPGAPGWMLRARRLSLALEDAIRAGAAAASMEAGVERAWAAWELDGYTDKQIARVAELVEKAHAAIRETPPARLEQAYHDIAQVIAAGLPRGVKRRVHFADLLRLVQALRSQADPWVAVVDATASILGWSTNALAHGAHAIRVALVSVREG